MDERMIRICGLRIASLIGRGSTSRNEREVMNKIERRVMNEIEGER